MIQALIVAACGWLLLVPPLVGHSLNELQNEPSAPLMEWSQLSAHDTARECESTRKDLSERMGSILLKRGEAQGKRILTKEEGSTNAAIAGQLQARCIPSDVLLAPVKK